jgi:hypothetical protein
MRQEYGSAVKFILMNSFSTSEDTRAFLAKRHPDLLQVHTKCFLPAILHCCSDAGLCC